MQDVEDARESFAQLGSERTPSPDDMQQGEVKIQALNTHPLHIPATLPEDEDSRVEALLAEGLLDTPPDEELDRFVEIGRRAFQTSMCAINFLDSDRQWSKASWGLSIKEVARDSSICAHCILGADPNRHKMRGEGAKARDQLPTDDLIVLDTMQDARFMYNELVSGQMHIRFYAGHPLCVVRGDKALAIGTFCVMDKRPRQDFCIADRNMLAVMAEAIILKIETSSRPRAVGPLASPCLEGGLDARVQVLKKCIAVTARTLADSALEVFAEKLRPRVYQEGQYITRKGEPGDSMFFVMLGRVEVRAGAEVLESHGPLQSFGEIALINLIRMRSAGVPEEEARQRCVRGADIVAMERCELLELCHAEMYSLIRVVPNLWFTLQEMAQLRAVRLSRTKEVHAHDNKDSSKVPGLHRRSLVRHSNSHSPVRQPYTRTTSPPVRTMPRSKSDPIVCDVSSCTTHSAE
jgi:CRP-like cAMP-binding protein